MGGVYAMVNTRGGGEYGAEWCVAGIGRKRQNAIDDYLGAAECRHPRQPHEPTINDALIILDFAGTAPQEVVLVGVVPETLEAGMALSARVAGVGRAEEVVLEELAKVLTRAAASRDAGMSCSTRTVRLPRRNGCSGRCSQCCFRIRPPRHDL